MWIKNQRLEGNYVLLVPIELHHIDPLKNAVMDGESWRLWFASVPSPEDMEEYVNTAIEQAKRGHIAYVVIDKKTSKVVGTTRYYDVEAKHRRASIGYTWYANSVRRTPINTEAKLLLLNNLFSECGALSVVFKTHFFNTTSRAAIERLGGKLDGVLRSDQIMKDGSIRDTAVYSIIASEWPAVRNNLYHKLNANM